MPPRTLEDMYAELEAEKSAYGALLGQQKEAMQSYNMPDEGLDVGTAIARVLAAGLPMAIAGGLGGKRAAGYAGSAGGEALTALQKTDALRELERKKRAQLEAETYSKMASEKGKRIAKMEDTLIQPDLAKQKAEATEASKTRVAAAGRDSIVVNPMSDGPSLTKSEVDAMSRTEPAVKAAAEKILQEEGRYPTLALMKNLQKNLTVPNDVKKSIAAADVTAARLEGAAQLFENIKDKNALSRAIVSRFPEFTDVGNAEKLLKSQIGPLALQMTVETQGSKPTDDDRKIVEQAFASADSNSELGTAKMKLLVENYRMNIQAQKHAFGYPDAAPLSEDQLLKYKKNYNTLMTGDDAIAKTVQRLAPTASNPLITPGIGQGSKTQTTSKTPGKYSNLSDEEIAAKIAERKAKLGLQ